MPVAIDRPSRRALNLTAVYLAALVGVLVNACTPSPVSTVSTSAPTAKTDTTPVDAPPTASAPIEAPPTATAASSSPAVNTPVPATDRVRKVALSGKEAVNVPGSQLSVRISAGWHKTRAPVIGVSVLFVQMTNQGSNKAEVAWTMDSGNVDHTWRELAGRRFDEASSTYVEEQIPHWRVRLDTIDDTNSGGSPTAVTISLKRVP